MKISYAYKISYELLINTTVNISVQLEESMKNTRRATEVSNDIEKHDSVTNVKSIAFYTKEHISLTFKLAESCTI